MSKIDIVLNGHVHEENLKQELECHILEAIDFYEENGFSYEKSVEKAGDFRLPAHDKR